MVAAVRPIHTDEVTIGAVLFDSGGTLVRSVGDPFDPGSTSECGMKPFPEVPAVLGCLRERGIRMAVVTDGWGTADSVRRGYERIGLAGYFDAFAVSGELGFSKPDPEIYRTASEALGVAPPESYYVDDHPGLVAAAVRLGYHGIVLCRGDAPRPSGLAWLPTLDGLLDRI